MEKKNQLAVIVKESKLSPSKAEHILKQFQGYFEIAAEWEQKAKTIVVTREDQKPEMEMARTGRLFLREKRIAVEKVRKQLKEDTLREGKAIDGISNVLKALVIPIEEYLDKQEHFVERREEEKREAMRLEIEKRIEDERIAKEKAEIEDREMVRLENEKLKKEAEKLEKKIATERKRQGALLAKERANVEAEKKAIEDKARKEREVSEKKARDEAEKVRKEKVEAQAKVETERKKAEAKARKEREAERAKAEVERKEKERLAELLKNQVTCPKCGHKFQLEGGKK